MAGYLNLSSQVATSFNLTSGITSFLDIESLINRTFNLLSSIASKYIEVDSQCENILNLESRIQTDFYGESQETPLPVELVVDPTIPQDERPIRPPIVNR